MKKRKWLSVLVAAIMVMAMLPTVVSADETTNSGETEGAKVAAVGGTEYGTLQEAVDAADGSEITLLDDIVLDSYVNIAAGATVKIKGEEKQITLAPGATAAFNSFNVTEGLQSGTSLTVENVKFQGANKGQQVGHAVITGINAENVSVELRNCTFTDLYDAVYCNFVSNSEAAANSITIAESVFSNVANYYGVDDGATSGGRTDKHLVTLDNNEGEAGIETFAVATVNGVGYTSLPAAVEEGGTVTLLKNTAVDSKLSLNKEGITLDLNNFEITASENFVYDEDASSNSHLVDVVADNVTVKNGTIKTTDQNRHALNVYNSEGVVLENLTLDHTNANSGAPLVVGASKVTIGGDMEFITGNNSWYAMNVDSREIGGNKTGSVADIADNTQLFFSGVQQGGIFIENTAEVPDNEVGVNFGEGVSMLAIDVIDNAGNFIPVAIRDGAAATVSNPENVTGMVFDEETGTYEVTHQISLIIDYVTEPGGEPIARDSMELMAPAGEFTWIYEENFSLESFPEGYNVIDWGGVAKEMTVTVVAGESNVYLYEVLVEKAENAGTGQQTPPAGENGAGADKNQGSPKTGDPFSLALLLGLMGAAGTGAGVALKRRSR
ncbi:MAG TPA: hypothetical protein IAC50_01310 [Candidatus Copromorpha excrementigallinarum]|uniref:Gram-positive cocci surface proteins LPxTG domain-containing protein n=1 Tax=Candidatus Allocopromorpha excrementigallinarum TaxID=2840742 RepID=A0A9D1I1B0_9FIRM|nr:hypothetical protein [Candidatus Copromorpha excrementigallinarum]